MIVYGDPAFTVSTSEIARAFATPHEARTIDQLRDLLIAAGQIEQAVADSGQNSDAPLALTDQVAEAFLAAIPVRGNRGSTGRDRPRAEGPG